MLFGRGLGRMVGLGPCLLGPLRASISGTWSWADFAPPRRASFAWCAFSFRLQSSGRPAPFILEAPTCAGMRQGPATSH